MPTLFKRFTALTLGLCLLMTMLSALAVSADDVESTFCNHHTEHTETCGYVEGAAGHPCEFVCPICSYIVIDWVWNDPYDILLPAEDYNVTDVDWVLGLPMLDEDDILALLPSSVTAVLKTGTAVSLPVTWDMSEKREYTPKNPPLAEATTGLAGTDSSKFYLITAHLPDGYTFGNTAAEPTVLVQVTDTSLIWIPKPDTDPSDLYEPLHFIIRHWHSDEASGTFDDGTSGKTDDEDAEDRYFVVAEGYIVKNDAPEEHNGHNYDFYLVTQSDIRYRYTEGTYEATEFGDETLEKGKLIKLTDESDSDYLFGLDFDNGIITLKSNPITSDEGAYDEAFSAYSISAGHDAINDIGEGRIAITYKSYVHLVKAHAFYQEALEYKLGSGDNTVFPHTDDRQTDREKDVTYVYVDSNGKIVKDGSGNPIREKAKLNGESATLTKVYNTLEGLHTDQTASASGTDGRTFDVELETWYSEGYAPQIGMVLDASGSMAFASDPPIRIKLTEAQLKKLAEWNIDQVTGSSAPTDASDWESRYFLTAAQLNELGLMDPHNTDNSMLAVSDYSYFVYDPDSATVEYVPLGYWEGLEITKSIGYYPFNKGEYETAEYRDWLLNSAAAPRADAQKVNQVSLENTFAFNEMDIYKDSDGKTNWASDDLKFNASNGFRLSESKHNNGSGTGAGIRLDVHPGESFTVSFMLYVAGTGDPAQADRKIAELMYIGPSSGDANSGYYRLYRDEGSSAARLRGNQNAGRGGNVTDINNVFGGTAASYRVTLVFENVSEAGGTVTSYLDGNFGDSNNAVTNNREILTNPITGSVDIIFNGIMDSYDGLEIIIDEIYVYDSALSEAQVKKIGAEVSVPNKVTLADGKTEYDLLNPTADGGWFYVSHGSWNQEMQTSKRMFGLFGGSTFTDTITDAPESNENANTGYQYTQAENSPIRFYVDGEGYLRCFFSRSIIATGAYTSYVYELEDSEYVKTETLQRALGAFVNQLYQKSPGSQVSAVRFSRSEIPSEEAVMLKWTSDAKAAASFMSLNRGDGTMHANDNGQYNYSLTGSTSTATGLQAYIDALSGNIPNAAAPKYLIVFTDGADTDATFTSDGKGGFTVTGTAITKAKELRKQGYTIYTVMLAGGSFASTEQYIKAKSFLTELCGPPSDVGDYDPNDYYFSSVDYAKPGENTADVLTDIFIKGILAHIVDPLDDYTVMEYIDPRFDLVDNFGNVWYLNADGKVTHDVTTTTTDDDGNEVTSVKTVTENVTNTDAGITITISGDSYRKARHPYLRYNSEKDMYYLEWTGQTVPTSAVGAEHLAVWNAKFKIKAKDDFIGGNAILICGNEPEMNWIYFPGKGDASDPNSYVPPDSDASSGTDDMYREMNQSGIVTDANPSKGFPRAVVNIALSDNWFPSGQTIFMGETLKLKETAIKLVETASNEAETSGSLASKYAWDYLYRYANKYSAGDPAGGLLANKNISFEKLIDYLVTAKNGDEVSKIVIPYSYLPNLEKNNQTGLWMHEQGYVGYLEYEVLEVLKDWNELYEAVYLDENDVVVCVPYVDKYDNVTYKTADGDPYTGDMEGLRLYVSGTSYFQSVEELIKCRAQYGEVEQFPTAEDGYVTKSTKARVLRLTVNFYPLPMVHSDENEDNEDIIELPELTAELLPAGFGDGALSVAPSREKANERLVSIRGGDNYYLWDKDYKPARDWKFPYMDASVATDENPKGEATGIANVGIIQNEKALIKGLYVTEIVSGEVQFQINVTDKQLADIIRLIEKSDDGADGADTADGTDSGGSLVYRYVARLYRIYDPPASRSGNAEISTVAAGAEAFVGTFTYEVMYEADLASGSLKATFAPQPGFSYMDYGAGGFGLPCGTYTLATDTDNCILPRGFKFGDPYVLEPDDTEYAEDSLFVNAGYVVENGKIVRDKDYAYNVTNEYAVIDAVSNTATLGNKASNADKAYLSNRFGLFRVDLEEVGDLTISKTVVGNQARRTDTFTFTVTMTDAGGKPVSGTYDYVFVDNGSQPALKTITFTNGKAEVTLKHGQYITIKDLPRGTTCTYSVTEKKETGYATTVSVKNDTDPTVQDENRTVAGTFNDFVTVDYTNNRTGIIPTDATTEYLWLLLILPVLTVGLTVYAVKLNRGKQRYKPKYLRTVRGRERSL